MLKPDQKFYRHLAAQGMKVRVGMEASGHGQWFERLLAELNFELWIGDAAEIRAKRVRKHKTDRQDAQHILGLLLENRIPQIWVPNWENRDKPDHRRTYESHRAGSGEVSAGPALDDSSRRGSIDRPSVRADSRPGRTISVWEADCLLSGTGAVRGVQRRAATSGAYHETRQSILRFLLVEAAHVTTNSLPEWRGKYFHLMMRRGRKIAKVAMVRRLAIRLNWMWRKGWDYDK